MNADPRIAELLSQPAGVDDDESLESPEAESPAMGTDPEPVTETKQRSSNRPSQSSPPGRRSGMGGLASFALRADDGPAARVMELVDAASRTIKTRPAVAIAASVGVGFLVGGALTFRAGRMLLATGARHVAREFMKQML